MDWGNILGFAFYGTLFFFLVRRLRFFKVEGRFPKIASWLFLLKLLGGIAIWVVYCEYYDYPRSTSDTFKFYDDAVAISKQISAHPTAVTRLFLGNYDPANETVKEILEHTNQWYRPYGYGEFNDNQTVIRVCMLLLPLTLGTYGGMAAIFNFFSFLGLWLLFKVFYKLKLAKFAETGLLIFLIPSVWFWSSGVMKENILLLATGTLLFAYFNLILTGKKPVPRLLGIFFSLLLMLVIKSYVLLCLLPGLVTFSLATKTKSPILFTAKLYGVVLLGWFTISLFFPHYDPAIFIERKQHDFINLAAISNAGSYFETFKLKAEMSSLLIHAPEALLNALFRPFPWNIDTAFMAISSMENIALFGFLIFALIMRKQRFTDREKAGATFFALFVFNLYILIGWVTPISGALVRYKIPGLVFWVFLCLTIANPDKITLNRKRP